MSRLQSWLLIIIIAAMMLVISGCRSLTPSVSYFDLSPVAPSSGSGADNDDWPTMYIGIGSIVVPGYLNRIQMVRRTSAYQLEVSSYHRWVDYPDRLVQQLIGENLQTLLPHFQIVNVPWPIGFRPDFSLSVQIGSLIGNVDQKVSLTAVWTLSRDGKSVAIGPRHAILSAPMADKGFGSLAEAHSAVIADLCRQMAGAIEDFQKRTIK